MARRRWRSQAYLACFDFNVKDNESSGVLRSYRVVAANVDLQSECEALVSAGIRIARLEPHILSESLNGVPCSVLYPNSEKLRTTSGSA